jgi:hypothetical protein
MTVDKAHYVYYMCPLFRFIFFKRDLVCFPATSVHKLSNVPIRATRRESEVWPSTSSSKPTYTAQRLAASFSTEVLQPIVSFSFSLGKNENLLGLSESPTPKHLKLAEFLEKTNHARH